MFRLRRGFSFLPSFIKDSPGPRDLRLGDALDDALEGLCVAQLGLAVLERRDEARLLGDDLQPRVHVRLPHPVLRDHLRVAGRISGGVDQPRPLIFYTT